MKSFPLNRTDVKEFLLWALPSLILLVVLDVFLLRDHSYLWIIFTFLAAGTLVILFDFDLSFSVLVFVALMPLIYVLRVHPAVIFSCVVLISALINFKGDLIGEVKNSLWFPLFLYLFSTLPSFVNTHDVVLSLRDYSNLISLFIVFFVALLGFSDSRKMERVFYFFVGAVFLHSLYVIYLGITSGTRAFGILGVYYIDYAGLASLLTFILMIYSRGIKRLLFSVSFVLITLGLIITQTRNAWISTAFAIVTLMIFLYRNGSRHFVKRKTITIISVVLIVLMGAAILGAGVNVGQRLDVANQTVTLTDDPESVGTNSFVSRVMIWHTAVFSFLEHPVIGIGAYSFKHTSQFFYVIPKGFYKLWVEGRTPHITYLQVLTETGILGLVFFLVFIGAVIKLLLMTIRMPMNEKDNVVRLMTAWSLIYIMFSMMMTESWLYGPYIVWFGIMLGFLVKINKKFNSPQQL